MNILFYTLLLLGSTATLANTEMENILYEKDVFESKTYYQTLGDLYQEGSFPSIDKLINIAWAGRCFSNEKPNTPINAGYILRVAKKDDVGPIGQEKDTYEVASYWKYGEPANFFDTMTIEEVYQLITPTFKRAQRYENAIKVNVNASDVSTMRLSGEYLIEEIKSRKGEDVGPLGNISYKTGYRCYYFIPEYEKAK